MKSRNRSLATGALLVVLLAAFSVPLFGRDAHEEMTHVGRAGGVRVTSPLRIGQAVLKPGSYVFRHAVEGTDHVVVFKTMSDK